MIPAFPRGVRRHWDRVRQAHVLLGPETALMLDEIGVAVLDAVDGARSVDAISAHLAGIYQAPVEEIRADVAEFLGGLAAKRLVDLR